MIRQDVASAANTVIALIYTRVSTSPQAEARELEVGVGAEAGVALPVATKTVRVETSLDTQHIACVSFAEEQSWNVEQSFADVFSGANLYERPGLTAVRERVAQGGVDVVLVYAQDRLSRSMAHVAILLEEFSEQGVTLAIVTESFEDSSVGRFMAQARAFAAEIERAKLVERTMRGRHARAAAGALLVGCKVRFGYQWTDLTKARMKADLRDAEIVRSIFTWFADGGTLRGVAMRLNDMGVPPPSGAGRGWRHTTIRKMVTDQIYTGRALAFRRMSVKVKSPRTGRKYMGAVDRPADEQVTLPEGTVERIVSDDLFMAANGRLAANKRDSARNNRNPEATLLRCGFVRCGYCGRSLAIQSRIGRSGQYTCKANSEGPKVCPGSPSMDAAQLDRIVWERVTETLTDPEIIRSEVKRRASTDADAQIDRLRITHLIEEVDQRRRNLTANLAFLDPDSAADVRAMLLKLADERRALEIEKRSAEDQAEKRQSERDRLAAIDAWCGRVGANLATMTYAQRRDALTAMQATVRIWKVGHEPRYEVKLQVLGEPSVVDTTGTAGNTGSLRRGQSDGA